MLENVPSPFDAEPDLEGDVHGPADLDRVLGDHQWGGGYFCRCGHELNSPLGYTRHLWSVIRMHLLSEPMVERAARVLAELEPGEDWPTNEALGGSLTGTRDDEYRDGLREQAREVLKAVVED